MKTRIQKWRNNLALRIPKSFTSEVGLQNKHRHRCLPEYSELSWVEIG
jgi:hypothetical protein